ncbi:MAG: DcaP family trimeric outer membrane transporter [Gammaproteobacteria bacterium]
MSVKRSLPCGFCLIVLMFALPATAQDMSLEALWEKIQELESEVDALKQKNAELEERAITSRPAPQQGQILPGRDPDAPLSAQEEQGSFEVYGFAQVDAIYDFNRVDPDWNDGSRPSKIPVANPDQFGSDGESIVSVRQSRIGFRSVVPSSMGPIKTWFEWDLYGAGNDAGDSDLNLRHFWGELGSFGGGQTWTNWMDIDIFPNTIDYWGPPGMVFIRKPQVRYTKTLSDSGSLFSVALEDPGNDVDAGVVRDLDPDLADALQTKEPVFDITARYRGEHDWGHWQLGGILRRLEAESTNPGNRPSDNDTGWGMNLTSVVTTFGRDQLKAGVVYGEGIAAYFNDGGSSLGVKQGGIEAIESLGISLFYDRYWDDNWSSSFGWSMHEQDNLRGQQDDAFKRGQLAQANLLWSKEGFMTGAEMIWSKRDDNNGADNTDFRVQYSLKYNFAHEFFD